MTNHTGPIPLVDLRAQYAHVGPEIERAVRSVLERGDYILGEEVSRFEQEFARFVGTKHAIGVASGLDALVLSLRVLGVGPGDEVLVPALTFVATAFAVTLVGATPVLCDVSPEGATLDTRALERAVTPHTRGVIPVHLYGQPADMESVRRIAARHGLFVVEDAAQAHGAVHAVGRVGTLGAMAAFSFYPGKNLGAAGDAGAVTTDDDAHAGRLQVLRNVGSREKYLHEVVGPNSRLDTIQAAVLRVKLERLPGWNEARARLARLYAEELASVSGVTPLHPLPATRVHAWHLFVVTIDGKRRDRVLTELRAHGVGAQVHYPRPLHLQPAYRSLGKGPGSFPVAERLGNEVLSLPLYPEMTDAHVVRVVRELKTALRAPS
jgi:dTDP-4-amino-4,6-dideoxygalactose transaminase